ncbi:MAG: hypothetical protein methR_P2085 [Methyloprofundus sp.]|nr:MAG: hypothetical protein methR_P2085 [Methyloprofundus sp.]
MNKKTKKIASALIAGKIAGSSATVMAGGSGLGKNQVSNDSTISLDEIGYPIEILTPPYNIQDVSITGSGSKTSAQAETGTIYTAANGKTASSENKARIDFVISNVQKQTNPVVVFLAYSTIKGDPSQWEDLQLGNIFLDRESITIISATQVEGGGVENPFRAINESSTPLGTVNEDENSIIISLNLSDLSDPEFSDNNIYFQVIALPLVDGEFVFTDAQISDLDHYVISRVTPGQTNSGSKSASTNSGGKSKDNTSTDTGSDNGGKSKDGTPTGGESAPSDNGGKGTGTTNGSKFN